MNKLLVLLFLLLGCPSYSGAVILNGNSEAISLQRSDCEKNEAWSISGNHFEVRYEVQVAPPMVQFFMISGLEL